MKRILTSILTTIATVALALAIVGLCVTCSKNDSTCTHEYSDWTVQIAPTCSSMGYSTRTCSKCGNVEYKFAKETGHDWELYDTIVKGDCETDSSYYYTCKTCSLLKLVVEEAVGHTYDADGVCTKCGYAKPSEGLSYELVDNDTAYSVKGIGSFMGVKVVIPDTYNGLPVTQVSSEAFWGSSIKSVTLGKNIVVINEQAFASCPELTSVTLNEGLTTISSEAFRGCTALTSITIPDGVSTINSYTFMGCTSLKSIVLGSDIKLIDMSAFNNCSALEKVYINVELSDFEGYTVGPMNDAFSNATWYYYSDTEPTDEGHYWYYDTDGKTILTWDK